MTLTHNAIIGIESTRIVLALQRPNRISRYSGAIGAGPNFRARHWIGDRSHYVGSLANHRVGAPTASVHIVRRIA